MVAMLICVSYSNRVVAASLAGLLSGQLNGVNRRHFDLCPPILAWLWLQRLQSWYPAGRSMERTKGQASEVAS
jgi:hypothetical protein